MTPDLYFKLKQTIIDRGYSDDINWSESIKPCNNADDFLIEFIFVVCNSGMKAQIARGVFNKIIWAMKNGIHVRDVFGHEGKCSAINYIWGFKNHFYNQYCLSKDKLEFCKSLPWIGDITKYHLAKNLGVDCIKPDRHLVRIAKLYNTDPFKMCQELSDIIGDKLTTVDTVIWRAANLGLI